MLTLSPSQRPIADALSAEQRARENRSIGIGLVCTILFHVLLLCLAIGVVAILAAQTFLNVAVALKLMPVTGVTLPFVSYGGSSMLGVAFAFGCLLALTRKRPGAYLYEGRSA